LATEAGITRAGPVWLAPGIRPVHLWTFFFCLAFGVMVQGFGNFMQPYLLTEHLGLPKEAHGQISGRLAFTGELIIALTSGWFGASMDRLGRRPVYVLGLSLYALSMLLFPLAATPLTLFLARAVYGLGASAFVVAGNTITVDYPADRSRGMQLGITGIIAGLSVVLLLAIGVARLPAAFQDLGFSPVEAGRAAYWIVGGLTAVAAVIAAVGLKGGRPATSAGRPPLSRLLLEGLAEGRANPRIALTYALSFVSRGDLLILTTFFTLWMTQAGIASGLSTADAVKRAGLLFALIHTLALLWAPVMGVIVDRLNRVLGTMIAMGLSAAAYLSTALVDDPMSPQVYGVAVLLGLSEISLIIAVQALLGQEARTELRGSINGVYSIFGAIGIMFTTLIGGILFDRWMPAGPFILMGVLNLLMFGLATLVWMGAEKAAVRRLATSPA
jgi:MFS family permease